MEVIKGECTPTFQLSTVKEAKTLNKDIFIALTNQKTAPAIAANQIGIDKRIIALNVREPLYLVNPKIVSQDIPVAYVEAHASFPNKLYDTIRFSSIMVTADNIKDSIRFGINSTSEHKLYDKNGKLNVVALQHPVIMEAVYVQQCIDTLDGIQPWDRSKKTPILSDKKYRRNEIVQIISNDGDIMNIKYKLIQKHLKNGWRIEEN